MKTKLPRHHHDVIEQMLDAVYDATDERDLLVQLKAVTAYTESVMQQQKERRLREAQSVK